MGVVANWKQIGGTRPYDAANGITTLGATSFDSTTGVLTIPATGTMFYINFGTSSSYEITSISAPLDPGRKVVIMNPSASGEAFTFTGQAVASFPGTQGQLFVVGGSELLDTQGFSFTIKQTDTGSWVQTSRALLS